MIAVFSLLYNNLELRSSSLTLGNASELSFLSLNRDLFTIIDIHSLLRGLAAESATVHVVPAVGVEVEFARPGVERADGGRLAVELLQGEAEVWGGVKIRLV